MTLTVVIGGARSGKSAMPRAGTLASGLPVRYVATAEGDEEIVAVGPAASFSR